MISLNTGDATTLNLILSKFAPHNNKDKKDD